MKQNSCYVKNKTGEGYREIISFLFLWRVSKSHTCWRVLKSLLGPAYEWSSVGGLMMEVATALTSKFDKGDYANLFQTCSDPWPCLLKRIVKASSGRNEAAGEDAGEPRGAQLKRLDVDTLKDYHLAEGQEQMFLKRDCQIVWSTCVLATCVYVMLKYTVRFGKENLSGWIKSP